MKTVGRRFVIEYKNRRLRKEPRQLWGDINLKAIAEEVEVDSTKPKNGTIPTDQMKTPSGIDSQSSPNRTTNVSVEPASRMRKSTSAPVEGSPEKAETQVERRVEPKVLPNLKQAAQNVTRDETARRARASDRRIAKTSRSPKPVADNKVISTTKAITSSKPSKAIGKSIKTNKSAEITQNLSAPNTVWISLSTEAMDDLASLDAENRRLKLLLIKQLRKENKQLAQMIDRASKPIDQG